MPRFPSQWGVLAVVIGLAGCGTGSPFTSVSTGSYACTAVATTNTCEVEVPSSPNLVDVQAGDILSLEAPASATLFAAPLVRWGSVQFGAQENPLSYYVSGSQSCGDGTAMIISDAQVTELGDDTLELTVSHRYTGIAGCTDVPDSVGDACELAFHVECTRAL